MTTRFRYVLSFAVQANKIGHAFLIDAVPYDWGLTLQANRSTKAAYDFTVEKLRYYQPELIITERITSNPHKGERARDLADAIWKASQDNDTPWMCVDRVRVFSNKYEEAESLAHSFPELQPYLPKTRTLWDEEPRRMIIIEAVVIGIAAIEEEKPRYKQFQ